MKSKKPVIFYIHPDLLEEVDAVLFWSRDKSRSRLICELLEKYVESAREARFGGTIPPVPDPIE